MTPKVYKKRQAIKIYLSIKRMLLIYYFHFKTILSFILMKKIIGMLLKSSSYRIQISQQFILKFKT